MTEEYKQGEEFVPEQGDTLKFQVQTELETEIKEKVAELTLNPHGRQIVQSDDALKYLRDQLGIDLASLMCAVDRKMYMKFLRKKNPAIPTPLQQHSIAAAYVVTDILASHLSINLVKEWLTSYSEYLYGVPLLEMVRRPDDVRMAALALISIGE